MLSIATARRSMPRSLPASSRRGRRSPADARRRLRHAQLAELERIAAVGDALRARHRRGRQIERPAVLRERGGCHSTQAISSGLSFVARQRL
jgi:hypothetical protein